MNGNDDTKRIIISQLKWFGIYVGIAFLIALLLPFPISFITALGVLILLNLYRRRRLMKRYGIDTKGIKNLFGWLPTSSSMSPDRRRYDNPLKYYCMNCGTEHKEVTCPKCGSKMKRVG
jgi:hypothetical protein